MELHFTDTGCHLPYGITQCYLPLDTSESLSPNRHAGTWFTNAGGMEGCHPTQANTPRLNPSHTGWYSIYRPRKYGGL